MARDDDGGNSMGVAIVAAAVGAAVGAAVALLIAPRAGAELRDEFEQRAREAGRKVRQVAQEAGERARTSIQEIATEAREHHAAQQAGGEVHRIEIQGDAVEEATGPAEDRGTGDGTPPVV
jgi:gas vesicle protein